jgi:hypothetical protein
MFVKVLVCSCTITQFYFKRLVKFVKKLVKFVFIRSSRVFTVL